MGLSVLNQPAAAGGGIKSVQRGSAGGAGNVTITAVNISKSFVTVYGTTSSGTVAASGSINATSGTVGGAWINPPGGAQFSNVSTAYGYWYNPNSVLNNAQGVHGYLASQNLNTNATSLTGGSNNLVAAVIQGYLQDSTTLVVSGACRWEVVEFN